MKDYYFDMENVLSLLPRELIYLISRYVKKMDDIVSLYDSMSYSVCGSSCYQLILTRRYINNFITESKNGIINPFTERAICNTEFLGRNINKKFIPTDCRKLFFRHIYIYKYRPLFDPDPYSGVIIYEDINNKIICNIKYCSDMETFIGDNWFKMWKQLSQKYINFILSNEHSDFIMHKYLIPLIDKNAKND